MSEHRRYVVLCHNPVCDEDYPISYHDCFADARLAAWQRGLDAVRRHGPRHAPTYYADKNRSKKRRGCLPGHRRPVQETRTAGTD